MLPFTQANRELDRLVHGGSRVRSLSEFDAAVKSFADDTAEFGRAQLWFRGHADAAWHLRPPALRHTMPHRAFDYRRRESHMFVELKRRGIALVDRPPKSDWGWLYLAQHHGVPTRLLDWSEGSHIALFFAVASRSEDDTKDACVWALNPGELNHRNWGFSDLVTVEQEHPEPAILLNPYRHGTAPRREARRSRIFKARPSGRGSAVRVMTTERPQHILAVIPEYVTARLRAQRGAFIAFADDPDDLLIQLVDDQARGEGVRPLARPIVIDGLSAEAIEEELDDAGVTASTVYPDITGLGQELARKHQLIRW